MNQLYSWMDTRGHSKDQDSRKLKTKTKKTNNLGSTNRVFSSRVACRINRNKHGGKWRTTQGGVFDNYRNSNL